MQKDHVRNILLDVVLTLVTCYLYNFYVQYRQIESVNAMMKERRYDFLVWILFCFITCGLYHIYHEYKKSMDIARVLKKDETTAGLIAVLCTLFGLWMINDAIQQAEINDYFNRVQV